MLETVIGLTNKTTIPSLSLVNYRQLGYNERYSFLINITFTKQNILFEF